MYRRLDEDKLSALLEAGVDEFSTCGPDKAAISRIAKSAGLSVGVIYKYYEDKDALFLACVRHSLQQLDEVLRDALEAEDDVEKSIDLVIRALIRHSKEHRNTNAMYHEITSGSCSRYAALLAEEIEMPSSKVYRELFSKAQAQGRIKSELEPGIQAFFFDNLLMMLQFSYCCEYYRERMKIFCGEDILENEDKVIESLKAFISSALLK